MNNKSVSDFVAATMNAVLNSKEHQSLFKTAQFNDVAPVDAPELSEVLDVNDASTSETSCDNDEDESCANDDSCDQDKDDESCVDDEPMESAAYDVAIQSLLTASAALDSIGMEKSATVSLKLASLIVDAKKLEKSTKSTKVKKDNKKDGKKDSKKDGKDSKKSKPASKPASKPTSKPASKPASKPVKKSK